MILAPITLWLSAVMFATFGFWLLAQPTMLGEWLSLDANSPAAKTEIRALYGGLELGIAAFCVFCALSTARYEVGLVAIIFLVGGIAVGRAFGMWVDGSASGQMFAFLGTEVVLVALAGVAWLRQSS